VIHLPGKLPPSILEKLFFFVQPENSRVIIPPKVGEDAGVVDIRDTEIMAVHSDPITASSNRIGWLSIHVSANDIAASGLRPIWFLTTVILPEGTGESMISAIANDIERALKEIGGILIGGHTEFSDSVTRPVISTTAIGIGNRNNLTPTSNAKPGDVIIMTKMAALEATSIAAHELSEFLLQRGVSETELDEAKKYINKISVVPEAIALSSKRLANAMHDATEGGIGVAAFEISYASGWAVEIQRDLVRTSDVTRKIMKIIGADPLFSLSSGTLLATVPSNRVKEAIDTLTSIEVESTIIGSVLNKREKKLYLRERGGKETTISDLMQDDFIKRLCEIERTTKR